MVSITWTSRRDKTIYTKKKKITTIFGSGGWGEPVLTVKNHEGYKCGNSEVNKYIAPRGSQYSDFTNITQPASSRPKTWTQFLCSLHNVKLPQYM